MRSKQRVCTTRKNDTERRGSRKEGKEEKLKSEKGLTQVQRVAKLLIKGLPTSLQAIPPTSDISGGRREKRTNLYLLKKK